MEVGPGITWWSSLILNISIMNWETDNLYWCIDTDPSYLTGSKTVILYHCLPCYCLAAMAHSR